MKKILSILICTIMLLTIIVPFAVSAEETTSIRGKYKFKDTLDTTNLPNYLTEYINYYTYDNNGNILNNGTYIQLSNSNSVYKMYLYGSKGEFVWYSDTGWKQTNTYGEYNKYIYINSDDKVSEKFYDWWVINTIPVTNFPWEEEPETEPPTDPPITEPEEPPIIDTPTSCNGLYCSIADANVDDICDTCGLPIVMMSQPLQTPQPYLEYYHWIKYKVYNQSTATYQQWFTLVQSDKEMHLVNDATFKQNSVTTEGVNGILKFRFEGEGTILGKNFVYNEANQYEQVTTFENGTTLFGVKEASLDATFDATFDIYYADDNISSPGDFFFQATYGPPAPGPDDGGESEGDSEVPSWGTDDTDTLWDFFTNVGGWFESVWQAVKELPGKVAEKIGDIFVKIFVPDVEDIEEKFNNMIEDIGRTFNLDFQSLSQFIEAVEERPIEDEKGKYYIYGVGELELTFLDTKYLKQGIDFFRPLIRGFIVFLLLLFHYKMILTFIGQDPSIAHHAEKEYTKWKEKEGKE